MNVHHDSVTEPLARGGQLFLYEDDVVRAVMAYLEADGWTIDSFALSHQHGDDIVARRGGGELIIEAKGDGSSKSNTARFGKAFTRNQVKTHVSVAVVRAMRVISAGTAKAALALPNSAFHRDEIARIGPALRRLDIDVYWVDRDWSIQVQ